MYIVNMATIGTVIEKSVDTIGYIGPQLLTLASVFLLMDKSTLLVVYWMGFIINLIVHIILKVLIAQPRPSEDKRLFNLKMLSGKRVGYDTYGMPSGHSQTSFYSVAFIHFALRNSMITLPFLLISLNTMYQRVKYKNHTIGQVVVGAIVGAGMGYVSLTYGKNLLKGLMRGKKDDNAFTL